MIFYSIEQHMFRTCVIVYGDQLRFEELFVDLAFNLCFHFFFCML